MCRQYYAVYEWCRCEESAGHTLCTSDKRDSCPGVRIETIHLHCFCYKHATTSWMTEKKSRKKNKRLPQSSESSQRSSTLTEEASPRKWYRWKRR